MTSEAGFETINKLTKDKTPFLCLIDYCKKEPLVIPLSTVNPELLLFEIHGQGNAPSRASAIKLEQWERHPVSQQRYRTAYKKVQQHLHHGDTYLLNLTFPTDLKTNLSLLDIFYLAQAKYKVWLEGKFVTFSPEPFIKIKEGVISAYPMKGTIRSSVPDASNTILRDTKETEEHLTIVDLIRNDLAMVASGIRVENFRYLEPLKTSQFDLLQVSSKISGHLLEKYWPNLGDLLSTILPAGSISGAPKRKTLEIINSVERYQRGYFTGIVGLFDGSEFDSGVMIRFVEEQSGKLIYKSGGGITVNSEWQKEYQEMIDKVYVPIV